MSKFKKGDRVQYLYSDRKGTITGRIGRWGYLVEWDDNHHSNLISYSSIVRESPKEAK